MAIIVEPNIKVSDISLKVDKKADYAVSRLLGEWGKTAPIIQVGDYILSIADIEEFELRVGLKSLPSFTIIVDDSNYLIRAALNKSIDTCTIFLGYKDWYIKFTGLINKPYSDTGGVLITLNGILYNDKLYTGVQTVYKDKKIVDILTDVCTKTSMGLFTFDNPDLNKELDYSLITGTRYIDYVDFLIKQYTNNVYAIDPFYYYHVGDIETIRKQKLDKYTLELTTGKKLSTPQDIVFKSINRNEDKKIETDTSILVNLYNINTNYTEIFKNTYSQYYLGLGGKGVTEQKTDNTIGIGSQKTNSFAGFEKHKFPFYNDKINKSLCGNSIKLFLKIPLFELTPLSVVDFQCYLPFANGIREMTLDTEHSGKKVVLNYSYNYTKPRKNQLPQLSQSIELI